MSETYEVNCWSKKFKVTPARLKAAVAAAGHSSTKVDAYLAKAKKVRKTKKANKARKVVKAKRAKKKS